MIEDTLSLKKTVSFSVLVALFVLLAVGLELVFQVSLRLPGHRALPGALALILFAQIATPLALTCMCAVVCSLLMLLPGGDPILAVPWLMLLPALWLSRTSRFRDALWMFLLLGMLFGLFRAGMLWAGFHKTPQIARLSGHLFFGALGGALAFGIYRIGGRKDISNEVN